MVPVERLVFIVFLDDIAAEYQAIYRLGIEDRSVEGIELILFDKDAALFASVEIALLSVQVGYFRINGDNGVGKLELIGQCIDEAVFADDDVAAGTCLIPAVAVTA